MLRNVELEHLPVIVRHLLGDTEDTGREITGPGMVDKSEEYLGVAMVVQTSKHDCGGQSASSSNTNRPRRLASKCAQARPRRTALHHATPPHRRVVKASGVDALERG